MTTEKVLLTSILRISGIEFEYIILLKSSQFSHKQLVLVAAPVSTGAYFF